MNTATTHVIVFAYVFVITLLIRPQTLYHYSFMASEVGRFELRNCDKMFVAQLVEMSHIEFPRPRPKKPEGGRHGIPPLKPLLPCRPTSFLGNTNGRTQIGGFLAKKVRASIKNVSNFASSDFCKQKGEGIATCGGRGDIPPQTPPVAPPA